MRLVQYVVGHTVHEFGLQGVCLCVIPAGDANQRHVNQ